MARNKIMTSSFKGPAPVLPGLGLHSFHADSPPFAAAGAANDHSEPEHFALGEAANTTAVLNEDGDVGEKGTSATLGASGSRRSGSAAGGGSSSRGTIRAPVPQRAYTAASDADVSGDEERSRARSRRLVSGYRFGNPPSPVTGTADFDPAAERRSEASPHRDSPPLTEPSGGDSDEVLETEVVVAALADLEVGGKQRRRSERSNAAFDALTGLNDGEADADDRARPAEGSSQAYLRGEADYRFPKHRLRKSMKGECGVWQWLTADESKIPLVIVACGSFSPPTYLHLRMFEMAKDEIVESQTYEIMAGYYSPVSSYYKKAGLAPAAHRVRMCELAVEHTSTWLMVDPWEAGQPEYQRTAVVLDHLDEMLNGEEGGVLMADGSRRKYKIMLLAGGDLIESFGEPGVWSEPDLHHILGRFGCLIVERTGSDVWAFLLSHDILYQHRRNVIVIKQLIYNDISSTKVRLFVRRGMSIKYLLPNSVIQYIHEHRLYRDSDRKAITR
ncbi:Nicotinamide/nicotinic acid mononucleotide adenylyltransferase 1 [Vanrija albida]|uniref:Nicotinamide/nicotinic acid mononucleotide adenylyltransferase 1 n=1 Tax=Vanrija albida TaxID=181172 RepID=A0ABR3PZH9_9TREE